MSNLNLVLHCGAHQATREQVIDSPTPNATRSWCPIPHHQLLNQIESSVAHAGLRVINEAHGLWRDGSRYFGLLELANGVGHDDYSLVVGVRNSHDKTFPAAIALGNGVFVCDNLSFFGEINLSRKHTRFINRDLPQVVSRAVGRLADLRVNQDQRIEQYRNTALTDAMAHDLVIRALDRQVVPVTKVPDVLEQWRQPNHQEFAADGKTAWRLFNGFTEALKGRDMAKLPKRTQALHGLLDQACHIAV